MLVQFTKKVTNVDFGTFGKKNLSVDIRLRYNNDEWQLYCYYVYIIDDKGLQTPASQLVNDKFIKQVTDDCLKEVQSITKWNM